MNFKTLIVVGGGMIIVPFMGASLGLLGIFACIIMKEGQLLLFCIFVLALSISYFTHNCKKPKGYGEEEGYERD